MLASSSVLFVIVYKDMDSTVVMSVTMSFIFVLVQECSSFDGEDKTTFTHYNMLVTLTNDRYLIDGWGNIQRSSNNNKRSNEIHIVIILSITGR